MIYEIVKSMAITAGVIITAILLLAIFSWFRDWYKGKVRGTDVRIKRITIFGHKTKYAFMFVDDHFWGIVEVSR